MFFNFNYYVFKGEGNNINIVCQQPYPNPAGSPQNPVLTL